MEDNNIVSFENGSQKKGKYVIRCDKGETPKSNTIYIDYRFNENGLSDKRFNGIRLCGTVPGMPSGEKQINTALEACKEYLRRLARSEKNADIYKIVLNHIKYNKSPNYVELAAFCERQIKNQQAKEEQER